MSSQVGPQRKAISSVLNAETLDLFERIYAKLGIVDGEHQTEIMRQICKIGEAFDIDFHQEVRQGAKGVGRKKSKLHLKKQVNQFEKSAQLIDDAEPFEDIYGTATNDPYAIEDIHKTERHRHAGRLHRRQMLKKLLQEEITDCRERLTNPGWQTTGPPRNNYSMAHGASLSNLLTGCAKLFEEYRPGEISHTEDGDFQDVAGGVYEIITGQPPFPPHVSLEHYVRKAVELHKKNIRQK